MFMKTFEEKWTAWIDDELSDAERVEFEASLEDRTAALAEKNQAQKLGALLKEELRAPAMGNEEFFHHQLRNRIAAESPSAEPSSEPARDRKLVDDRPSPLDWRFLAGCLCGLCVFRDARGTSSGSIAVSHANFKCEGRSRC